MENTLKVLFGDDPQKWFIAVGNQPMGPLRASDVYARLCQNEISWAHYVWTQGLSGWKRACDTHPFSSLVPRKPEVEVPSAAKRKLTPSTDHHEDPTAKIWFLHVNGTQHGPFHRLEIEQALKSRRIHAGAFAWREGMTGWKPLSECAEWKREEVVLASPPPAPQGSSRTDASASRSHLRAEKRTSPRKPLLAKVWVSDNEKLATGLCKDLSAGGMLVLTNPIPGPVGTRIRLNVSPMGKTSLKPFVAHGIIVRILEDGRGFSFRFEKLSEAAKRTIESFVESEGE